MERLIFVLLILLASFGIASGITPENPSGSSDATSLSTQMTVLSVSRANVYSGNMRLSYPQVNDILSPYPAIANQFNRGVDTRSTGLMLIIGGAVCSAGGIVMMVAGTDTYLDYYGNYTIDYSGKYYTGLLISAVGELMIGGGIACSITGKMKIRRSIQNYNRATGNFGLQPRSCNYSFGLLDNGSMGLRVTF